MVQSATPVILPARWWSPTNGISSSPLCCAAHTNRPLSQVRDTGAVRIVRCIADHEIRWAALSQDDDAGSVQLLSREPWHVDSQPIGQPLPLRRIRLIAPAAPSKVVAVGRNYADHVSELGLAATEQPRIFFKPPSSVIGPGEPIHYPNASEEVHHEAELAVVIGRTCRNVRPLDAEQYIFGYTCANDVTARDIQRRDGQPSFAKSFDTFCPLGPWVETGLAVDDLAVGCVVNGEVRQSGRTSQMLWSVPGLLSYISGAMTLHPGDVILTGTPSGVGPLYPGDVVTVTLEGIGSLSNPVVSG